MDDRVESPWRAGRLGTRGGARLLFGATYEDASIEQELFGGAGRVCVVGGAGDTVLALADQGRMVVAVDVNPAQVQHVRARLEGGPRRRGLADRMLGSARLLAPAAGWTGSRVESFLDLDDVEQQRQVFDGMLDTARFRMLMDWGLAPASLLRAYRPEFIDFLPPRFGSRLRQRLRRGLATHPNRDNPYASLLLAGRASRTPRPAGPVELYRDDAAAFLESQRSGTYDGFSLSNILDGPDRTYATRLARAVEHAGRPDAVTVLRTLREPAQPEAAKWARRDRSLIWGGIIVATASEFPYAVKALA